MDALFESEPDHNERTTEAHDHIVTDNRFSPYVDERCHYNSTASSELEHQRLPRGASPTLYLGQRLLPESTVSKTNLPEDSAEIGDKTRREYSEKFSKFLSSIHDDDGSGVKRRDVFDVDDTVATDGQSVEERPSSVGDSSKYICDNESAIEVDSADELRVSNLERSFHSLSLSNVENGLRNISSDQLPKDHDRLWSESNAAVDAASLPSINQVPVLDSFTSSASTATVPTIDQSSIHDFIPLRRSSETLGYCDIPDLLHVNDDTELHLPVNSKTNADRVKVTNVSLNDVQSNCNKHGPDIIFTDSIDGYCFPKSFTQDAEFAASKKGTPFFDPKRIFASSTGLRHSAVNGEEKFETSHDRSFQQTSSEVRLDRNGVNLNRTPHDVYPLSSENDKGSQSRSTDVPGAAFSSAAGYTTPSADSANPSADYTNRKKNTDRLDKRPSDRRSQNSSRRQNRTIPEDATTTKKSRGKLPAAGLSESSKDDATPSVQPDAASSLPNQSERPSVGRHDRTSGGQANADRPKGRSRFHWSSSQKSGTKKTTSANSKEANEESTKSTPGRKAEWLSKWSGVCGRFCRDALIIIRNILLLVLGLILVTFEWLIVRLWRASSSGYTTVNGWWRRAMGKPPIVQPEPTEEPFDLAAQWRTMNQKETLSENIALPETGEEAMKRLFAGHGKDPYSILGLRVDCTDEQIRKYYRKQAVLVHPDKKRRSRDLSLSSHCTKDFLRKVCPKNREPGAEEAFKILNQAFDMIGEPEKRSAYDAQSAKDRETDAAMNVFADLLTKLKDRMKESMDMLTCETCGGTHKRIAVDRTVDQARFCDKCATHHSVREGDVWAESSMLGFLWKYYACMDNQVYDITKLASCQRDSFKHLKSNAHLIRMRISTGRGGGHQPTRTTTGDASVDELLNSVFRASGLAPDFSQFSGAGGAGAQANSDSKSKQRQKKKKRK